MALPSSLLKIKNKLVNNINNVQNPDKGSLDLMNVVKKATPLPVKLAILAGGFALFMVIFVVLVFFQKFMIFQGVDTAYASSDSSSSFNSGVACSDVVDKYMQWAVNIANDDSHGYSQVTRYGNPNYDCASYVWYALTEGAGLTGLGSSPFWTGSMPELLTSAGWKEYIYTSVDDLQIGDILLVHNSSHQHTEIYYGNGQSIGAHSNYDGKNGDSGGNEICPVSISSIWEKYYRYEC